MAENQNFRYHAKAWGLTYSCPKSNACRDLDAGVHEEDCNCSNPIPGCAELRDFLYELNGVNQFIVSEERHESGKLHYHVYVKFDAKVDSRDVRYFDFVKRDPAGREIRRVHPNVIKSPGNGWKDYVVKAGEWISNFYEEDPWREAMNLPVAQALARLRERRPRDMILHGAQIRNNLINMARAQRELPALEFNTPLLIPNNNKTLLVYGPSGMGKTEYALRTFANGRVIRTVDGLRKALDEGCDGLVFDDMTFKHLSRQAQIAIVDLAHDGAVPARYGDIIIPAGLPRIMTYNDGHCPVDLEDPAIRRRCELIHVPFRLF